MTGPMAMTSGDLPDFGGRQACLEVDPDMFFPDSSMEAVVVKDLQRLCSSCPVLETCLEYALAHRVTGIWAGTTTSQRRQMRKAAGVTTVYEDQRMARARETVRDLAGKGCTPAQIVAQTGLHEQTVWRTLRAMPDEAAAAAERGQVA